MNENKDINKDDNKNINSIYEVYYEDLAKQKFNPWVSICTEPRITIRYIINNQPRKYVLLLTIIYGILQYFEKAVTNNMGDNTPMLGICFNPLDSKAYFIWYGFV